jgi:glycosyltransferase involved in cell wall biosynthesis
MSTARVLILGGYPVRQPRHGGQIRLAHIATAYRSKGFEVHCASFFPGNTFYLGAPRDQGDIALPPQALKSFSGAAASCFEDFVCGPYVAAHPQLLGALERKVEAAIDVVHLEQPWLLPVVEQLWQRGRLGAFRLVYGSQNIETPLKRESLERIDPEDKGFLKACEACEMRAARQADLVIAVTPDDAKVLAGWTDSPVVLAPNGVQPWVALPGRVKAWRDRLGSQPFALYVASAHHPNIHGFFQSFGESLAGLPPTGQMVLVGGAAELIVKNPWFQRWRTLNQRRIVHLGVLGQEDLDAVRELAHTYILPILTGGGSNLKTAEALHSGRHVVATSIALRGFEVMRDLPGCVIAEPGPAFVAAVVRSLNQPLPLADPVAAERRESLVWTNVLAPLADAASMILARPSGKKP